MITKGSTSDGFVVSVYQRTGPGAETRSFEPLVVAGGQQSADEVSAMQRAQLEQALQQVGWTSNEIQSHYQDVTFSIDEEVARDGVGRAVTLEAWGMPGEKLNASAYATVVDSSDEQAWRSEWKLSQTDAWRAADGLPSIDAAYEVEQAEHYELKR